MTRGWPNIEKNVKNESKKCHRVVSRDADSVPICPKRHYFQLNILKLYLSYLYYILCNRTLLKMTKFTI